MRKLFPNGWKCVLGLACVLLMLDATPLRAQKMAEPQPYDSIGANGVTYAGPGREAVFDLRGSTVRIGIVAPIHGPQKADGEAIIAAAKIAIQDASRKPLPDGRHFAIAIADESVPPWGLLGDEMIHLIMQDKVVAMVTGADGVAAHLSEQIGNKIGVATLTLSGDDTSTEINMPWIFRMGPSDGQQAQVMARNIYGVHDYKRVLLVAGQDHDGQIASREFLKAVHRLGAPAPAIVAVNPLEPDARSLPAIVQAKGPQAIVMWTLPENAKALIQAIRAEGCHAPIYLSQKAAQTGSGVGVPLLSMQKLPEAPGTDLYGVDSTQRESRLRESFVRRYQLATGRLPSPVAAEAYDAVRLVAQAVREAGPNRARVRDEIATARNLAGVSGSITFDNQGNNRTKVYVVPIPSSTIQQARRAQRTPPHRKVKADTQE